MHPLTIHIPSCYVLHHEKATDNKNHGIRWKGGACLLDINLIYDITLLTDTKADLQR